MGGNREWRLFVSQEECARKISDVFLFDLHSQLSLTASVTKCPKIHSMLWLVQPKGKLQTSGNAF